MRSLVFVIIALSATTVAQQEWSPETQLDGGVSQVLQSIYVPPIHDAPFTATVHTEWARPLAGGGNEIAVNQRKVARDRDGRIYEERWALVPKNSNVKSVMNVIQIYDPNKHSGYDCFLLGRKKGQCELKDYSPSPHADPAVTPGPLPNNMGYRIHAELGIRDIEGIETVGTRDTTVVNSGVMGNDRPMTFVREYWRSAKLGINLISIVSDLRFGRQTFTLTDISVTEVDPKYYQLPEGFVIDDERKDKTDADNQQGPTCQAPSGVSL